MALKNFLYSLRTWKVKQTPQSEYEEWMCFLWYSYKSLRQKILRKRKNMQCVPINMSSNWVHFKYMNQTVDKVFRKLPQMTSVQSTARWQRTLYIFLWKGKIFQYCWIRRILNLFSWAFAKSRTEKSKVPLVVHTVPCLKWYWTHINYVVNWWTVSLWFLSFKILKT